MGYGEEHGGLDSRRAEVIFLIDEMNMMVDATMENIESVHRTAELGQQNAPLAGKLKQVVGVILKPLADNAIFIQTENGITPSYEVRPLIPHVSPFPPVSHGYSIF